MADTKGTPTPGAGAGPAPGGVGTGTAGDPASNRAPAASAPASNQATSFGTATRATEPGRPGPKNPPLNVTPDNATAAQRRQAAVVKPKTVMDKVTGQDITPGYAGARNPPLGVVTTASVAVVENAEPNPAPAPPKLPEPLTPADPRPGDFKPGHSGNVPTEPLSAFDAAKLEGKPSKETQ